MCRDAQISVSNQSSGLGEHKKEFIIDWLMSEMRVIRKYWSLLHFFLMNNRFDSCRWCQEEFETTGCSSCRVTELHALPNTGTAPPCLLHISLLCWIILARCRVVPPRIGLRSSQRSQHVYVCVGQGQEGERCGSSAWVCHEHWKLMGNQTHSNRMN